MNTHAIYLRIVVDQGANSYDTNRLKDFYATKFHNSAPLIQR